MARILFDIEADGFLETVSKIHCICTVDVDTEERRRFGPNQINQALSYLQGHTLIAHNGLGYDFLVLEKLHGFVVPPEKQLDTLSIARLKHPNVKERDKAFNQTQLKKCKPTMGEDFGKHTLRAWGKRLHLHKADFEGPWDGWSQEMEDYCAQDVETNLKLWKFLNPETYSQSAIELEHRAARLCRMITEAGWPFNEAAAAALHVELLKKKHACEKALVAEFGGWWAPRNAKVLTRKEFHALYPEAKAVGLPSEMPLPFVPKRDNARFGYVAGAPCTQIEWVQFNPSSRQHVVRCLMKRGWEPTEYTDSGQPKLDEEVIENLGAEFDQADTLVEYLMLEKRLGQLAEGANAWLKHVKNGRIHAEYNPMGAVTSRASHFNPNIAQVPAGSSPYGHECRSLFTVPEGWELLGADMSGLEGRCLAHYLAKYDNGAYGYQLLSGDPHWQVVLAVGYLGNVARDKGSQLHTIIRETGAKRLFYGMLYGAGDLKAGRIILEACRLARKTNPEWGHVYEKFFGDDLAPDDKKLRAVGKAAKSAVVEGITGFSDLMETLAGLIARSGTLPGLDLRRLPIRSEHAALNTLLQSAGAILCKRWICDAYDMLIAAGFKWGWDGDFVFLGWIHDELQIACRAGLGARIGPIVTAAARGAGEPYGFRIALDSEYKIGKTWADTH